MNTDGRQTWWESLRHFGLVLSPNEVTRLEADRDVPPLPRYRIDQLRREMNRLEAEQISTREFAAWVLQNVCDFGTESGNGWQRGASVPLEYRHALITGESLRPQHLWTGENGGVVPVFFDDSKRLGQGRSRKTVGDCIQWLRRARRPLTLLTNGRQWRLVFAGLDFDAACEWDTGLWFEEGEPGAQLEALRRLLHPDLFDLPTKDDEPPLLAAIHASRRGQSELSSILGERVREAVETLVRAHGDALNRGDLNASGADIYRAAVRVVMRMVVILFAESRDLLPRATPIYHDAYGLQGLFDSLQRVAVRGRGRLEHRLAAWPRVLALFRLIYEGSHHEALEIPQYGGDLFEPGDPESPDPMIRALSVFERACFDPERQPMPDVAVYRMLELLTRTQVRVRQGRATTRTTVPVDFSDLSSEYIGILYEGLLDYELRTAPEDEPMVFLAVGDEPALPMSRLEAMEDRQIKDLFETLKETRDEGDEETEAKKSEDEAAEEDIEETEEMLEGEPEPEEEPGDHEPIEAARRRALAWTQKACVAAGLVRKPRGPLTPEKQMAFDRQIEAKARQLVRRVVLPGEWYLVRWGGTRKGAGTFYTRPQLAVPTVHRTLRPLAYTPPTGPDGEPDREAPAQQWTPKKPEEILARKVCDPGCGSGSFLVASVRFLTDAVYAALHAHGRLAGDWRRPMDELLGVTESAEEHLDALRLPCRPEDDDFESRTKAILRRYVVERCIYGVDIDPLAVELCKLSLWIETMDRDLPFSFLDHKIRCGNSLVGTWFDQFQDYPVMAWEREGGDKNHDRFVHHFREYTIQRGKKKGQTSRGGDKWTQTIKDMRNELIKPELKVWIQSYQENTLPFMREGYTLANLHSDILVAFEQLHGLPVNETSKRQELYQNNILSNQAFQRLKEAFDTWCAIWFWPGNQVHIAPTPRDFLNPKKETRQIVAELTQRYRFFHWELAFPEVFIGLRSGFDAVVGNPPWDIQKPNSKEFFSNVDPLYRTYGKQEALRKQTEYFTRSEAIELDWLDYSARLKALSNWVKNIAYPFGDPQENSDTFSLTRSRKENEALHLVWRKQRTKRRGYANPEHPFRHQGSADINTYKMFLEAALVLSCRQSRIGLILPSGVHNDLESFPLRLKWLPWLDTLAKFDNERRIFEGLEHNSKFDVIHIDKGKEKGEFQAAFFSWMDAKPLENLEDYVQILDRDFVMLVSPTSLSIPEIRDPYDKRILQKLYDNGRLLGRDFRPVSEFHLTNDSTLFSHEGELPVYQGGMIWLYDHRYNYYDDRTHKPIRGKLEDVDLRHCYPMKPKNWVSIEAYKRRFKDRKLDGRWHFEFYRIAYRIQSSRSNQRTFVSTLLPPGCVTGNSLSVIVHKDDVALLLLLACLNSFVHDFNVRTKVSSNINNFYIPQFVQPVITRDSAIEKAIIKNVLALVSTSVVFEPLFQRVNHSYLNNTHPDWNLLSFAITRSERLRLSAINDALILDAFNLSLDEVSYLLSTFPGVDSKLELELRQTTLTFVAFQHLKRIGPEQFLTCNNGEGWMLPETLRLADYGLGHDDRAKKHQPVASRLGPRFYDWQLEQDPEESWRECELHARNLLGEEGYRKLLEEIEGKEEKEGGKGGRDVRGEEAMPVQGRLFET